MANDKIYCDKCGAENEVGSSFCKKCGADLHGTSAEKPSNVWYLLPILLGIIGGIIGYIVIKAKDGRMARNPCRQDRLGFFQHKQTAPISSSTPSID